jgi:Nucleotide modification associated domain 2
MKRDLSGQFVLTSVDFVYFGREAITIPPELRPAVPKGQSGSGVETHDEELAERFIRYAFARGSGVLGAPHSWSVGDVSWNQT